MPSSAWKKKKKKKKKGKKKKKKKQQQQQQKTRFIQKPQATHSKEPHPEEKAIQQYNTQYTSTDPDSTQRTTNTEHTTHEP